MSHDAAVEALAQALDCGALNQPCDVHTEEIEQLLSVMPALLRADTPAGEALRERLGLRVEVEELAGRDCDPPYQRLVSEWEDIP